MDPDSASVLFLDKVVLPVVMQDRFPGLNVQKTVGFPQLQFLTEVVATPVEIPQAQFLDKVYMSIVVSGADGQTVHKTVEFSQVQFFDKVDMPVVCMTGAGFSRHFSATSQVLELEGSRVALTPGVSPRCQATSRA